MKRFQLPACILATILCAATYCAADPTHIGHVIHKAFLDVNEEGAEAAAATGVIGVVPTAMPAEPPPPMLFRANPPFIFLIRQRSSGAILFMGRVASPIE
jgi:serpin B